MTNSFFTCLLLLCPSTQAFLIPAPGCLSSTGRASAARTATSPPASPAAEAATSFADVPGDAAIGGVAEAGETSENSRLGFLRSLGGILSTAVVGSTLLPSASEADVFTDDVLSFKFETPEGWQRGDAQISGRRKIIVYTSPQNPGANAFVAYTPVKGDFTTLGSFGTLDEVSKTILPEADGVKSNMVDSYTSKNAYVYDYVVDQNGRPKKHIKTMWLLFPAEGQLVTVTAQCNEDDYGALGKGLDNLIASVSKM